MRVNIIENITNNTEKKIEAFKKNIIKLQFFNFTLWKKALRKHYTAPLETSFKQFKLGAILFTVGFIIIYLTHQTIAPSVKQELLMLCGVIITGVGFVIALAAHIRMLITRVIFFLKK